MATDQVILDALAAGTLGGLLALGMLAMVLLLIVLYVYWAFVWMTIAKKLKYDKAWIAWIPIVNLFLLPILSKKHWAWGFLFFVPLVNFVTFIVFSWQVYERRKYPGWLSLVSVLGLLPFLGVAAFIAYLVILGLVAWKDM